MSCSCNTPAPTPQPVAVPAELPTIGQHQALCGSVACADPSPTLAGSVVGSPCPPRADQSQPSCGTTLPSSWTDAKPVTVEGLTLLARLGTKLAKFVGSGFLQLRDGKAYLVQSIQLQVQHLWHHFFKPDRNSNPILGNPLPSPYVVIADAAGKLYAMGGYSDEDSIQVYSFERNQWENRRVSEFPLCKRGQLTQANRLEIVGFEPIPAIGGDPQSKRCLKSLSGDGIVVIEMIPTTASAGCENCPECEAEGSFSAVARVLPFPELANGVDLTQDEVARHILVFSSHGLKWEAQDDDGGETPPNSILGN